MITTSLDNKRYTAFACGCIVFSDGLETRFAYSCPEAIYLQKQLREPWRATQDIEAACQLMAEHFAQNKLPLI